MLSVPVPVPGSKDLDSEFGERFERRLQQPVSW